MYYVKHRTDELWWEIGKGWTRGVTAYTLRELTTVLKQILDAPGGYDYPIITTNYFS